MVRSGAALMNRSGGNDAEVKFVMEAEGKKTGRRGVIASFREANRLRRGGDFWSREA